VPSLSVLFEERRSDALARFASLPHRDLVKPSRFWKHDLAKLDPSTLTLAPPRVEILGSAPFARRLSEIDACDPAFTAAFGQALDSRDDRYASLGLAFASDGVFVAVPARQTSEKPIKLAYHFAAGAGSTYSLVHVAGGARVTVIERISSEAGAFGSSLVELVLDDDAQLTYLVEQSAASDARILATRRARIGARAQLDLAIAELGAELSVNRARVTAAGEGAEARIAGLFFATGRQHVDFATETRHDVGNTTSRTVIRSAAAGRGQGRYFGNIAIAAQTAGCDASLRDDALLLSEEAHIDSVPALEIASNDVRAYHGATVGSLDEDELFYACSRGIDRSAAERMIALGFFEPALVHFGGEPERQRLRDAIGVKLTESFEAQAA